MSWIGALALGVLRGVQILPGQGAVGVPDDELAVALQRGEQLVQSNASRSVGVVASEVEAQGSHGVGTDRAI